MAGMRTNANRELVQGMYDAARRGDLDGFFGPIADDVIVVEPPFLPYGGVYRGKDGLQELFAKVSARLSVPTITVDRLLADGDHVLGFIRVQTVASGAEVSLAELSVIRDGKVAEMRIYFHDAADLLDDQRSAT